MQRHRCADVDEFSNADYRAVPMPDRVPSSSRSIGWLAGVLMAPVVLLTLLDFPRVAFDVDHDLSSSASIEYFAARDVQFGTDLLQNVGPLGWAHQTSIYAGYLHTQKLLIGFATRAALAILVLWACTRFKSRGARVAWLLAIVAPLAFGAPRVDFPELLHEGWAYLNVYLAVLALLALPDRRSSAIFAAPLLLLLAVLALEKHTLLVVASLGVGGAALDRLGRPHARRSAFALIASFLGSLTLVWWLCGQEIAHIPRYLLGIFRFGSGYNEAMALPATAAETWLGVAVALALTGLIALRTITGTQTRAKTLVDAALLFVVWKHGFVRADPAHVGIFFHTAIPLALLFGCAHDRPVGERSSRVPQRALTAALATTVAVLSVVGLGVGFAGINYAPSHAIATWTRNAEWILQPGRKTAELAASLRKNQADYESLPLQQRVGRSTIDFFGYQPGWLLLNGLEYVSRPMPISFAAANAALRRRNEAFYRNGAASPEYVLAQISSGIGDLLTLDDGLAFGALLDNYRPLVAAGHLVLLRRNPAQHLRDTGARRLLAEVDVPFGQDLSLEAFGERWIWLEVDVQPSWLGRVRSFVLRPATIAIVVSTAGHAAPLTRRYVASMGSSGFLASPHIEDTADFLQAYVDRGAALPAVTSVRFDTTLGDRRYFEPKIRVRVLAGEPPPSQATLDSFKAYGTP